MRHSKPAAVIAVASFVLWACSTAPSTSSRDDDHSAGTTKRETSETEGTTTGKGNDGTSSQPGTPGPQAPGGACTPAQGEDACYACCEAKHPAGAEVIEQLVEAWVACACAPTACAKQCAATACSEDGMDPVEGDACDQCLLNTGCDDQFESACQADAACAELETCASSCFPEEDDEEEEEEEDDADRARFGRKAQRIAERYSHLPLLRRARR